MARKPSSKDDYQQLSNDLASGKLLSVYMICGEEQFFIDRLQEQFLGVIPEEVRDFNMDLLYGQDINPQRVLDVARSFPMMAERRLVLIREFFNITKVINPDDNDGETGGLDLLISYIENPSPSTVLVLIDKKKPNKNTKFYKALVKSDIAGYFEFDAIPDFQVSDWIISWAKSKHNKIVERDAAELLYQFTGSNLHQLSTELEKICTFNKTDEPVTKENVKAIAGFSRQFTVFELKDAVLKRDLHNSLFIAERMLQGTSSDTGEVIRVLAFFYSTFSQIWQYQRLVQKGVGPAQLSDTLGMNDWRLKRLADEARRFRPSELPAIFETLLDADRAVKGFSKLDPEAIFVMTLRRIIA